MKSLSSNSFMFDAEEELFQNNDDEEELTDEDDEEELTDDDEEELTDDDDMFSDAFESFNSDVESSDDVEDMFSDASRAFDFDEESFDSEDLFSGVSDVFDEDFVKSDFRDTEEYKQLAEDLNLQMILDSFSFIDWSYMCNINLLLTMSSQIPDKSNLSAYDSISKQREFAFKIKKAIISGGHLQNYTLPVFVKMFFAQYVKYLNAELKANKSLSASEISKRNVEIKAYLEVFNSAESYRDFSMHRFSPSLNLKSVTDRYYKIVEMLKCVWESTDGLIDNNSPKELKSYINYIKKQLEDAKLHIESYFKDKALLQQATQKYEKHLSSGSIVEDESGVYTPESQRLIDTDMARITDAEQALKVSEQAIHENFVFPKTIKFNKNKCEVTCSCGACIADEDDCHTDISKRRFITFNIIQYGADEYSLFKSNKLAELLERCKNDTDRVFSTLLKELQNYTTVLDETNTLTNSEIVDKFGGIIIPGNKASISNETSTYINRTYGYSCMFQPFMCPECHRIIMPPPKLMRYLAAWHASHDNSVYSNYNGFTSTGFIIYKDSILNGLISDFNSGVSKTFEDTSNKLSTIVEQLEQLEESGEDSLELINARNSLYTATIVNDLTVMDEVDTNTDVIDITESNVEEVYRRVMMRKNNFMVSTSIFDESVNRTVTGINSGVSNKSTLIPSSFWASHNTSDDDKYFNSLKFILEREEICNNITPILALNSLFKAPCFAEQRTSLLMYGYLSRVKYNLKLLKRYANTNSSELTTVIYSSSPGGLISIGRDTIIRVVSAIKSDLAKLNDVLNFTNSDTIQGIDPDNVTNDTIRSIDSTVDALRSKESIIETNYKILSNPLSINLYKIDFDDDLDAEVLQFISDELPWKMWADFAMLFILVKKNPAMFKNFVNGKTPSQTTGAKNIFASIKDSIKPDDAVRNTQGETFINKIPPFLRNAKIDRTGIMSTMTDCILRTSVYPLPVIGTIVVMLLNNVTDDEVVEYIRSSAYLEELLTYAPDDEVINNLRDSNAPTAMADLHDFSEFLKQL